MATTEFPPPQPLTIDLSMAQMTLRSPKDLRFLVDHLGDLSAKSIEDLGPLVFAVLRTRGDEFPVAELLKDMLKHRSEWVNQVNEQSYNLLMEAIVCRRLDLVDVLIDAGVNTAYENLSGFGVLDVATSVKADPQTQEAFGNALLGKGSFSSLQKDRALNSAAHIGNLGMTRSLLAHGAGFASVSPPGATLAEAAALKEDKHPAVEIVRALLQAKGGHDLIDEGWATPGLLPAIHRAAMNGSLGVMAALLEAGARVDVPDNLPSGKRTTPLMAAAYGLQSEAIDLLLKSGCDPAAVDHLGRNALHHLANHFSSQDAWVEQLLRDKAIKLLATAGTDPRQADTDGNTPMDIAVQRTEAGIIESFTMLAAWKSSQGLSTTTKHPAPVCPGPPPPRM